MVPIFSAKACIIKGRLNAEIDFSIRLFNLTKISLPIFSLIMGRDLHSLSLHYVMFMPTIQNQTDEEQLDEWLGLAISRAILGTYAQTELGHGT